MLVDKPQEAGSAFRSPVDYGYNLATSDTSGAAKCCGTGIDLKYVTGAFSNGSHGAQDTPQPRHFDGANYLFCDGHVKFLRGAQVYGAGSPNDKLSLCKVQACYSPDDESAGP